MNFHNLYEIDAVKMLHNIFSVLNSMFFSKESAKGRVLTTQFDY